MNIENSISAYIYEQIVIGSKDLHFKYLLAQSYDIKEIRWRPRQCFYNSWQRRPYIHCVNYQLDTVLTHAFKKFTAIQVLRNVWHKFFFFLPYPMCHLFLMKVDLQTSLEQDG